MNSSQARIRFDSLVLAKLKKEKKKACQEKNRLLAIAAHKVQRRKPMLAVYIWTVSKERTIESG